MSKLHCNQPPLIEARSHTGDGSIIKLRASDDLTGVRNPAGTNTPLFMLWAHCVGELPPVNCIDKLRREDITPTLSKLMDAHACFEGVQRPHLKEDNGNNVLVYILKPAVTIRWKADMACVAHAVQPRLPFVLTVQVVLNPSLQEAHQEVEGVISRIEAVACDPGDDTLPVGYADRYGKRCW